MRQRSAGCQETSFSASEDTAGSLRLYCLSLIFGPYRWCMFYPKKMISKDGTLFLSLSIASNIDASMMSINMFKLAVRDLRCITHRFPSLCNIFEMPHFICNGPTRIWVWNWWEDENKQLSSAKPSHNENLLPNMQPPQFFLLSPSDKAGLQLAQRPCGGKTSDGSGQYCKPFTWLTSDISQI